MGTEGRIIEKIGWAPFEPIDEARHFGGIVFDALGWGPVESAFRVLLRARALTVRAYTAAKAQGPVVLIIPAPIKRAYIWDLLPGASAVQEFVRSGARVYLIQWETPGTQEQTLGLAEYAGSLIQKSLQAVQQETGCRRVILAGHSLGGTFAAIFAARYPEAVQGLLLLDAPLHFGPGVDALSSFLAQSPPAPLLSHWLGRISGSFLSAMSLMASPSTFAYSRCLDWLGSLPDREALRTHLAVERWTYDEMPLPRQLFEDIAQWLYQEDRFMRGVLEAGGQRAMPQRITAPLLCVVETQSEVVPPASVRPFYDAVRSAAKHWLLYEGDTGVCLQHVGMLVGKRAHEKLWPVIRRWVQGLDLKQPQFPASL